jgi:hypothetical protein
MEVAWGGILRWEYFIILYINRRAERMYFELEVGFFKFLHCGRLEETKNVKAEEGGILNTIHCKKAFRYSRPQPGCHLPNSPWAGIMMSHINYSRLGRAW